jgi:hypothetical protein
MCSSFSPRIETRSAALAEWCAFLALTSGELWAVLSEFLRANPVDASQPEQQMTEKIATRTQRFGYAPDKLNRQIWQTNVLGP